MAERTKRELVDEIKDGSYLREAPVEFINTGSTVLNLAASGFGKNGGWARARVVNIVGDESTGKTILAIEAAFHAFNMLPKIKSKLFKPVKNVVIKFINREGVLDFPIAYMYGEKFAKVLASGMKSYPTAEEAGRYCIKSIDEADDGTAIICIIDSWDALSSEEDEALLDKAIKENKPIDGTYNLGKQKFSSKYFFKRISDKLQFNAKDFTLIICSQTRSRIGVTFGKDKYRAGGAALDFYAHQVCWLYRKHYLRKGLNKEIRQHDDEKLEYGIVVEPRFEKNKTARPFRKGLVNIIFDYGIDDITSMVDWYFAGKGEFEIEGMDKPYKQKEPFIQAIIKHDLISTLQELCENKFRMREEAIKLHRPSKF